MDSIRKEDGAALGGWKALFGGHQVDGRIKFSLFMAAYLLAGGLTLAQWA